MCNLKSALVLKDRVFMPEYDSHSTMIDELKLNDSSRNPGFVRVEISPPSGNVFESIASWEYKVDQDFRPDWYVSEYDERRVRESLAAWAKDRNGKYVDRKALSELSTGQTFKIRNVVFLVLDKDSDTVSCLSVGAVNEHMQFDANSNNFAESSINKYLNGEYLNWLSGQVGADNIVEHTVDLKDYYGNEAYDSISSKVSLLTLAQYHKYANIIPKTEQWYWLATPLQKDSWGVCGVDSDGDVDYYDYDGDGCAVRPFCIFKSSILVDCECGDSVARANSAIDAILG